MREEFSVRIWRGLLFAALLLAIAMPAQAADYRIGGTWQTEGGGFIEKGVLRVSLTDAGWLKVITTYEGGVETITGYEVYGELEASRLGVNAWSYRNTITLGTPIPIKDFNPSMSDPFKLPPITIDDLTYTLELTSVTSGTLKLRGYVDVDVVGRCEVNADNAIWKQGTPKPDIPDSESGCNAGATLPAAAILLGLAGLIAKGRK